MKNDLGITLRPELMPAFLKHLAESTVVEDLAVEDDPERSVFIAERLSAGFKINDRQARMCKPRVVIHINIMPVGTAQSHRIHHFLQKLRLRFRKIKIYISRYSAHFCSNPPDVWMLQAVSAPRQACASRPVQNSLK